MEIKTFTYKKGHGSYYLDLGWQYVYMDDHIQQMLNTGWEAMNSMNDPGHVRVGKTLVLTALTGGLSLFFGASRSDQTITITFKRHTCGYCSFCGTALEAGSGPLLDGVRSCSACWAKRHNTGTPSA